MLLDPLTQLLSSDNDEDKVSHEAFKGQIFTSQTKFNFHLIINGDYIHCDTLMMQQKEARKKHPCVLPACSLKKLTK